MIDSRGKRTVGPGTADQGPVRGTRMGILLGLRDFNNKVEPKNIGIYYTCLPNCKYGLKVYGGNKFVKIT